MNTNGVINEKSFAEVERILAGAGWQPSYWPGYFSKNAAPAVAFQGNHGITLVVHNSDMIRQAGCVYIGIGKGARPADLELHADDEPTTIRNLIYKFLKAIEDGIRLP